MSTTNLIVGVGSPHGDDQAGWLVVDALRRRDGVNASVVAVGDGSELIEKLGECERLIVVDACRGGASPGTVTRWQWPNSHVPTPPPQPATRGPHSSHGFGVESALKMAAVLGKLPARVIVFGVEAATSGPGEKLSLPVRFALRDLERQVLKEISQ